MARTPKTPAAEMSEKERLIAAVKNAASAVAKEPSYVNETALFQAVKSWQTYAKNEAIRRFEKPAPAAVKEAA